MNVHELLLLFLPFAWPSIRGNTQTPCLHWMAPGTLYAPRVPLTFTSLAPSPPPLLRLAKTRTIDVAIAHGSLSLSPDQSQSQNTNDEAHRQSGVVCLEPPSTDLSVPVLGPCGYCRTIWHAGTGMCSGTPSSLSRHLHWYHMYNERLDSESSRKTVPRDVPKKQGLTGYDIL